MKAQVLILAGLVMTGVAAHADGFVCADADQTIGVKIFDHTHADEGTRTAAVMVVSDLTLKSGSHTTARFQAENLSSSSADYTANVDLRFSDSNLAGRNIGGTKLGELDMIKLNVDFRYDQPVKSGDEVPATLILEKRNGSDIRIDMTCTRYLKN